jgi:hypothetical protein
MKPRRTFLTIPLLSDGAAPPGAVDERSLRLLGNTTGAALIAGVSNTGAVIGEEAVGCCIGAVGCPACGAALSSRGLDGFIPPIGSIVYTPQNFL